MIFALIRMGDSNIEQITLEILVDNDRHISQQRVKIDYGAHNVWTIVAFSLVYAVLSLTAFLGNSLVIWIIRKLFLCL